MDDTHADEAVLHLDSVDFNALRPGESTLAKLMIKRVREGGAMIGGVFAEALIAEVTGASFPRFGISSWDLRLDEITIQVRASSRGVFNLRGDEDVFVFTDQSTDDWRFYVVPQADVSTLRVDGPRGQRRTVGRRRLAENVAVTALHELADAIRVAADRTKQPVARTRPTA